ncbi:MAG TPA: sigma-70 family RNA polymerase sigma factor [Gammaproteobacteria bacterium]|nr:sigma-70 family RNA polymerase sigma factor [Gammaproteobacteria bacterium]
MTVIILPGNITAAGISPDRWLDDYGDSLYRYALRKLGKTTDAEDMVQETLVAALQSRASYKGHASEKTWLTGILKHKIMNFIRIQVREKTVDDIGVLSDAAMENDAVSMFDTRGSWIYPPTDWGDPDKILHNHQFIDSFERCLKHLKPALAEVFSLKEIMGVSNQEICKKLDITMTNCSVMLYRARMGLRSCLETKWSDINNKEM